MNTDIDDSWIGKALPRTDLVVRERVESMSGETLYRVSSEEVGRDFCAKVYGKGTDRRRWRREIESLAEQNNPHIVKLFRTLEVEDQIVVILEWVEGKDLRRMVESSGPLSPHEVVLLGRQLVQALQGIHERGFVHRGISPRSVIAETLASGEFFVRLTHFGLARRPGKQTTSGLFENPAFTAPEQIEELAVDHRTDMYQLGCLLYYLLVGEPPFVGSETVVLNKHLYETPPRASSAVPMIRRWRLDDLILRLMEKQPENRPADYDEILEELLNPGPLEVVQTNPLPPSKSTGQSALSSVGPDQSVVTATRNRIVVRRNGKAMHFEASKNDVTAVHAAEGRVYFGTSLGEVFRLDVPSGKSERIAQLARSNRITQISRMNGATVASDAAGDLFLIADDGRYRVVRTASSSAPALLDASEKSEALAVVRTDLSLTLYNGKDPKRVAEVTLDFAPAQLAVSPDGYVVAVIGEEKTWIVNAVSGEVMHRLRARTTGAVTFHGSTLIGLDYDSLGEPQLYEIY